MGRTGSARAILESELRRMVGEPAKTRKQHAGQFQKGQSGNPSGGPEGSRNATTLAVEKLLEGEADEIGRKAIELAKAGDERDRIRIEAQRAADLSPDAFDRMGSDWRHRLCDHGSIGDGRFARHSGRSH
jgi:hypothetical protein